MCERADHERWAIALGVCRASRAVIEECFKWTQQREVFGKPLIDQHAPLTPRTRAHAHAPTRALPFRFGSAQNAECSHLRSSIHRRSVAGICATAHTAVRTHTPVPALWRGGGGRANRPVIRAKLAHMVAQNEAVHAWVERITYQLDKTPLLEQAKLAGPISLLKLATTRASLARLLLFTC